MALAGSHFQSWKAPMAVDRFLSKFLAYLAIGLVVLYLWEHSGPIEGVIRARVGDWWH
jgi:hypothetical protein